RACDRLYKAQTLDGPAEQRKHVYLLASHSHQFLEDVYNTAALNGKVLPGWIVGTAGAEQYTPKNQYGYLQVRVKSDGTIETEFVEVSRDSPPKVIGAGAEEICSYCFEKNSGKRLDIVVSDCGCGTPRVVR